MFRGTGAGDGKAGAGGGLTFATRYKPIQVSAFKLYSNMAETPFAFGPFILDPARSELRRDGEVVPTGQRGIALLSALLQADGKPVSKAELMEQVWPSMIVEEGNLTVQIATLRKLLGQTPDGQEWITTIPRVGYRLHQIPHAPVKFDDDVWPSLAVLPFQNLSGDQEQEYFADGVVEDIITALSRFKSFAVIARNSSFIYKGRAVDVRDVASQLGVRYILEGSVRRAGDMLRISAQLCDGKSGANLWVQSFDGARGDVFEFQDLIAASVAMIVEPQILEAEIEQARRDRPESLAAYDLYLRALPKFHGESQSESVASFRLISEALALEPDNGTYLALAIMILGGALGHGWPEITGSDRTNCSALVERALSSARSDALVMGASSHFLTHQQKDYELGQATAHRAFELNPNNFMVAQMVGVQNLHCARLEDALACFQRAMRLSPADTNTNYALTGIAHAQMAQGNFCEALATAERSLPFNANYNPTYWMLIAANAQLGRMDEARRWLAKFKTLAPSVTVSGIRAGQPAKYPDRMAAILEGLRRAGLPEE